MGNELIIAVLLLNLQLNRMGLHISRIVTITIICLYVLTINFQYYYNETKRI
jgi:hypothetical protein